MYNFFTWWALICQSALVLPHLTQLQTDLFSDSRVQIFKRGPDYQSSKTYCLCMCVIGASLSEPHTSVLNGGFSYIYIYIYLPYVHHSVNASWHSFNWNIAHADPCGRNIKNNYVKTVSRALSLPLTEWSSISAGVRRPAITQKETEPDMLQRQRTKGAKDWETESEGLCEMRYSNC